MNNSKKRLIALATSAAFCFSTATAIYAAPTTKTLNAIFNGIKISYNGQIKTDEKEPFIVDNTTYV
ncbi:MAG: copper amine oxidase N-terminal domain-containing protein, partial [Epulopiscium sp.]|nr:copper amine oxidase N-terminal domain-containing protein [Candidatus Epulonipiscium sp.]